MSEMEPPLEQTQEDMHHHAHHATEPWIGWVALTSAIIAALSAVTILIAGNDQDKAMEALIKGNEKQTEAFVKSNDEWNHFGAKSVKAAVLKSKMDLLEAMDKKPTPKDRETLARYDKEMEEIQMEARKVMEDSLKEAQELQRESDFHAVRHGKLAIGVTLFAVAIAVAAISVLSKQMAFWFVGLAFAAGGVYFLVCGVALKPELKEHESAPAPAVQHH